MLEDVPEFNFYSLVRKNDNKEVYTSRDYHLENGNIDIEKVKDTLNFYFNRVNSSIEQQMNSPKLNDDQKKNLKFLNKDDFIVRYKAYKPIGLYEPIFWEKEANDFLK